MTPQAVGMSLGVLLEAGTIVVDEALTSGPWIAGATKDGPAHDWLSLTGGSIGMGLPLSVGAAVAAPDRRVVTLQADGSSLYTIQALWTMAREQLDVTVILLNNRSYAILAMELERVGATAGPRSLPLLDLSNPAISFADLARGFGVEAYRADNADDFHRFLAAALSSPGPSVVEAILG